VGRRQVTEREWGGQLRLTPARGGTPPLPVILAGRRTGGSAGINRTGVRHSIRSPFPRTPVLSGRGRSGSRSHGIGNPEDLPPSGKTVEDGPLPKKHVIPSILMNFVCCATVIMSLILGRPGDLWFVWMFVISWIHEQLKIGSTKSVLPHQVSFLSCL
jgi:hypothetical protein